MSREIEAKTHEKISISDGRVKKIFETRAKLSGNGAIIYVPKRFSKNKFYVVVC